MDAATALERARAFVKDGEPRAAIDSLSARVIANPSSAEDRRALAQLYRELGYPDQAGRWGLLVADFATEQEHESFVRMLRNLSPSDQRAMRLVALSDDMAVPAPLADALSKSRPPIRSRIHGWTVAWGLNALILAAVLAGGMALNDQLLDEELLLRQEFVTGGFAVAAVAATISVMCGVVAWFTRNTSVNEKLDRQ